MKSEFERAETVKQVSAGGVAFRRTNEDVEVALILTSSERRWQLPKGMIDDGETDEEAAIREVREEAGIDTDLVARIARTEYWFTTERDGRRYRIHKYVHWFLLRYSGGDVRDHDHEVEEARWVDSESALKMLAFRNEREVVRKALLMVD